MRGDDDPRVSRRGRDLRRADCTQREVAERAAAVPALEALLGLEPLGASVDVDLTAGEPLDPRQPVAALAATLGVQEVIGQELRLALGEAELAQLGQGVFGPHLQDPYELLTAP